MNGAFPKTHECTLHTQSYNYTQVLQYVCYTLINQSLSHGCSQSPSGKLSGGKGNMLNIRLSKSNCVNCFPVFQTARFYFDIFLFYVSFLLQNLKQISRQESITDNLSPWCTCSYSLQMCSVFTSLASLLLCAQKPPLHEALY